MTSIINFQALSGAYDESAPCYILQIDEFKFMLDCGWDEQFNEHIIAHLKRHAAEIDAVLLSHADVLHLGALPYAVGKCGLNCPIYATIPVYKMGQMFMYDWYQSRYNMEQFDLFTLDDVDMAFEKIVQLKYNQSVSLKGKGAGIMITPLNAGHMIGGTAWKIVRVGEEEEIVYAVDYNHKKERHLNSCQLDRLTRPSLLITDAFNATYQQARRRARDEKLMTTILQTLRNGGNVLIAVDTAGRVLELMHMLDQLWRNKDSGLLAYSLALINNVSYNVVEFAKSQIEWMSDKLMKSFEGARNNPFQFKHLQLCHTLAELNKISSPKVVLSSTADMECGFSRDLFIQWASNENNSIILTARTSVGTLSRRLMDLKGRGGDTSSGAGAGANIITVELKKRVRLEGAELEQYQCQLSDTKLLRLLSSSSTNNLVELSSDDSDDNVDDHIVGSSEKCRHDLLVVKRRPTKQQSSLSSRKFFKSFSSSSRTSRKPSHPIYPFIEQKVKYDDYGEFIRDDECKMLNDIVPSAAIDKQDGRHVIITNKPHADGERSVVQSCGSGTSDHLMEVPVPTKCVVSSVNVTVNASVQFIDFEGRSDGESIKKIISQLKPRRIVLVRGSPDSMHTMRQYCSQFTPDAKLYIPKLNELIDVTIESHIYQVRLTDALVSSLEFEKGKDVELAWLDARISLMDETKKIQPQSDGYHSDNHDDHHADDVAHNRRIYTLEALPINQIAGHQAIFINELKLSDFKQVLSKCDIQTEILGGVLYCCNGTLAVRRIEQGKVVLEGCLSDDYYKIRQLLYQQYAIV